MIKIFIKISAIIFGNLFAFLVLGYILTKLLGFDRVIYVYLLLISIVSLVVFLRMEIKSYKGNVEKIITKVNKNNGE